MAKKRYYDGERRGAGMMNEDPNAIAGLPTNVVMEKYPETPSNSFDLNDDITGVDKQISDDVKGSKVKSGKYPEKY